VENINTCLTHLAGLGISIEGICAKDIKNGNLKSILDLFFSLSRYKQEQKVLQPPQQSRKHHKGYKLPGDPHHQLKQQQQQQQQQSQESICTSPATSPSETSIHVIDNYDLEDSSNDGIGISYEDTVT
ncbi:unnamed protein product, partial [Candidula unifasciata]